MAEKAKKSLGQNFLTDKNILHSIVLFSGVTPGSQVLEIGPGRGALTENLLEAGATVKAIELDPDLVPALEQQFHNNPHITIQAGDILNIPLDSLYAADEPYQVVANIPYYITAPIIRKLLTEAPAPLSITILVQKEVAERLAGGAKTRSVLTVAAQYYSRVTAGPIILKKYFDPIPKVDSQLVTLVPYRKEQPSDVQFFRVVKAGFAARRKTLFNNLVAAQFGNKKAIQDIFTELDWSVTRRAQELEVEEWEALTKKFF
jgi:16S rRNA (adenine1518-N6/adenine1519-N6)-dimethyltransferase